MQPKVTAPDLVLLPEVRVIDTKPDATQSAEHGGFTAFDAHVPVQLSNPAIPEAGIGNTVTTITGGPTILAALDLDPISLLAVKAEGTKVLPVLSLGD